VATEVLDVVGGAIGVYDLSHVFVATSFTNLTSADFQNTATGTAVTAMSRFVEVRYVNQSQSTHFLKFRSDPGGPAVTLDEIQCLPDMTTVVKARGLISLFATSWQPRTFVTTIAIKVGVVGDPGQVIAVFDLGSY